MATTINSYNTMLTMDASSYIRNSELSRQETASLTREINAARTPAENYERKLTQLDKALKAGAIEQATYNRLVENAKQKFDQASGSTQALQKSLDELGAVMKRELAAARTPAENYEHSIKQIDQALKAGIINQQEYNRLLESSKQKFDQASGSSQALQKSLDELGAEMKRELAAARTPAENYEHSIKRIDRALKAGIIDQQEYNRLVENASEKLNKASRSTASFTGVVTRFLGAWAGIHTVVRGVRELSEEMANIDQLAKTARGLNATVLELERFRLAVGEIAGQDIAAADEALRKLDKRIGEASLGMGEAVAVFDRLGLSVAKLSQLSPEQQFIMVSQALQQVSNSTEQAALASKLFEDAGVKLLPLLRSTREEYEASAGAISRLGLDMSDDFTANVEKTNDAIGRLNLAMQGWKRTVLEVAINESTAWHINEYANALGGLNAAFGMLTTDVEKFNAAYERTQQMLQGDLGKLRPVGTLDPQQFLDSVANQPGVQRKSYNLPNAGLLSPPKTIDMGDISEHLGDAIDDSIAELRGTITSWTGWFADNTASLGSLEDAARQLNKSFSEDAEKKGDGNNELAKSFEVGTQEAYRFIAQQQQDVQAEERQHRKKLEQETARSNQLLTALVDWAQDNGFRRYR